ncbi:MAG: hypothetical protein H0U75_08550 [Legionella sp.]|nr:hypothetical protein [Legionella sp.]
MLDHINERLLASKDKALVMEEACTHTQNLQIDVKNYLRDSYVLLFH